MCNNEVRKTAMDNLLFTWDDFPTTIKDYLKHDMDLVDVTLACDGNEQIQAHRIILSAGSSLLRDVFKNATDLQPFIFLSGVGKTELQSIVDFLYCGEIKFAKNDLEKFLEVAKFFQITGIKNIDSDVDNLETVRTKPSDLVKEGNSEQILEKVKEEKGDQILEKGVCENELKNLDEDIKLNTKEIINHSSYSTDIHHERVNLVIDANVELDRRVD